MKLIFLAFFFCPSVPGKGVKILLVYFKNFMNCETMFQTDFVYSAEPFFSCMNSFPKNLWKRTATDGPNTPHCLRHDAYG